MKIYVDDYILASTSKEKYNEIKSRLVEKFNVKELPLLNRFLGKVDDTWYMNQEDAIKKLCQDFKLENGRKNELP